MTSPLEDQRRHLDELLAVTSAAVVRHLDAVPAAPVAPPSPVEPAEVRAWLAGFDLEAPRPASAVVDDLMGALTRWGIHTTHPGYFGLFNPTPSAPGVAGELVTAAVNPQLAAWSHAPAAVEIEQRVLQFTAERLGIPVGPVAGNVTVGGAEANLTAVLLALTRTWPALGVDGLRALPGRPVLYASAESHLAWLKIAHLTGLGRDAVRLIGVDPDTLRMDVDELRRTVEADRREGHLPFFVAATAGTTGGGAIDPLDAVADVTAEHGLWMHTDAAWAGAVAFSDHLRPMLGSVERSDSVTVDAHKWLSVPMGAGMIVTRHGEALAETFRLSTAYMPSAVDDAADPYTTSVQWSRRAAGIKIWLALAATGRVGYAQQLERDVEVGETLAAGLDAAGWRRVNSTRLPLVCVTDPAVAALPASAAWQWHVDVCEHVVGRGRSWITPVRLAGRPAVRACVTSYRTGAEQVRDLIEDLDDARKHVPVGA